MFSNHRRPTLSRLGTPVGSLGLIVLLGSLLAAPPAVRAQQPEEPGARTTPRVYPDDPLWLDPDTFDIAPVKEFDLYEYYDFFQNQFGDPGGPPGPALDINTLDEVPDSSWFTNRIGRRAMTVAEVVRGPDTVAGPAPGVWTVTGRPSAGITPKFTIRDARGDTYLIKLDPPAFPALASSAEVIATKIFHAIGYHVPENYVIHLDLSQLELGEGVIVPFDSGPWVAGQRADLDHWLRDQPRRPDGTIRAIASRYISGTPVGQFRYYGTRRDDANDLYPHERRRPLRALRVFAAWLNQDDTKALNTFDALVEDDGRRYIRHYLLDFGASLGSDSTHAKRRRSGYEHFVEPDKIVKGLLTFGLWRRGWMKVDYPDYPSVGRYEADFFEPWKWRPNYPNPAFDRMDTTDAFWAARIVSRFTDELIRAIVAEGQISDPQAAAYLTDVIITRRDKVVNYWISRTNPLDRFEVDGIAGTGPELTFENAAIRVGAAQQGATYRVRWSALNNLSGQETPAGSRLSSLAETRAPVPDAAWGPADDVGDRYAVAAIHTLHPDFPHWREPVVVSLRDRTGEVNVVGIERPRNDPNSLP
ncbi:MAG: hypothetical protein V3W06_09525 [Acidimicrobiia bacterium]